MKARNLKIVVAVGFVVVAAAFALKILHHPHDSDSHAAPRSATNSPVQVTQSSLQNAHHQVMAAPIDHASGELSLAPLDLNPDHIWDTLAKIRKRHIRLGRGDYEALKNFLCGPMDEAFVHRDAAIKNEILTILGRQSLSALDYAALLVEVFTEKTNHFVLRDYALQHLSELYERAPNDPSIRKRLRPVFWGALTETDSQIAGTALLALVQLGEFDSEIDPVALRAAALNVAENGDVDERTRISSLQVCAHLQEKGVLRAAWQLIEPQSGSLPLQASAIAAIGALGSAEDLRRLKSLRRSADGALDVAIQTALTRLGDDSQVLKLRQL